MSLSSFSTRVILVWCGMVMYVLLSSTTTNAAPKSTSSRSGISSDNSSSGCSEEMGAKNETSKDESSSKSTEEDVDEAGSGIEEPVTNSTIPTLTNDRCKVDKDCGPNAYCEHSHPLMDGANCLCYDHFIDNTNGTGCVTDPETCNGKKDCAEDQNCCEYGLCDAGLERRCYPQTETCPEGCGSAKIIP